MDTGLWVRQCEGKSLELISPRVAISRALSSEAAIEKRAIPA